MPSCTVESPTSTVLLGDWIAQIEQQGQWVINLCSWANPNVTYFLRVCVEVSLIQKSCNVSGMEIFTPPVCCDLQMRIIFAARTWLTESRSTSGPLSLCPCYVWSGHSSQWDYLWWSWICWGAQSRCRRRLSLRTWKFLICSWHLFRADLSATFHWPRLYGPCTFPAQLIVLILAECHGRWFLMDCFESRVYP